MKTLLIATLALMSKQAMAAHYGHFYENPTFWVSISFVIVVFFLAKPVSKAVLAMLHSKTNSVLSSIQNASAIRNDAQKLLQDYQSKQKNMQKEVDNLLKDANEQTQNIKTMALEKIKKELEIKEMQLTSTLNSLEQNAKNEIIEIITQKSIAKIKDYISANKTQKKQEALVDKAIESI